MTATRTLAFGDDGSSAADRCFEWIVAQRWPGWTLDVVSAEASIRPPAAEEARLHLWDPPHPRVPPTAAAFDEVRHLTCRLDPRLALSRPVDLLAIGPKGPGLLKALHLGSTAEWLLQQPPSPLVVARGTQPVRSVLVCHDGSEDARIATDALARLPLAREATMTVLVVDDGRIDADAAATAATLQLGSARPGDHPDPVETLRRPGRPTAVIADVISNGRFDLVVLGTRGHTGLRRLTVGSTAAAITRISPCSVLVAGRPPSDD